jgi:hypothetical protein
VIDRDRRTGLPPTSGGWKLWFAFVGVLAAILLGVAVWAIVRVVLHYT